MPVSEHEISHEQSWDHLTSKSEDDTVGLKLRPAISPASSSHVTASLSELIGPDDMEDESDYEDQVANPMFSVLKRFIELDNPTEPTSDEPPNVAYHCPNEETRSSHLQSTPKWIQSSNEVESSVLTAPQELSPTGNCLTLMEKLCISPSISIEPIDNECLVRNAEAYDNVGDQPLALNTKFDLNVDDSMVPKEKLWISPGVVIRPNETSS